MSSLVLRALERELLMYRRMWRGSAFSAFVQPLLFLGAMGLGLGSLIDDTGTDASEYIVFVAPGLMAASAILAAAGESLWGILGGVKWMGSFNAMVSTAMLPGDVYGGRVLSSGVRTAVTGSVFLSVAVLLGGVSSWLAPFALVPTVLIGMAGTAWLAAYAVRRESDKSFSIIMRLGIIPLFLFSGTFFPVDQLPDAIESVIWLSPLWHAVESARDFTAGGVEPVTLLHIGILLAVVAAAIPVGIKGFERRLTP
ncbi:MAG: ABC transporter permease [Acidimicrobiales bacterium]|nr:ABC transporter permease [Acidimicrobiales bacterium]